MVNDLSSVRVWDPRKEFLESGISLVVNFLLRARNELDSVGAQRRPVHLHQTKRLHRISYDLRSKVVTDTIHLMREVGIRTDRTLGMEISITTVRTKSPSKRTAAYRNNVDHGTLLARYFFAPGGQLGVTERYKSEEQRRLSLDCSLQA